MIERVAARRRLASATYHPSSPHEEKHRIHETLAEQTVAVFSQKSVPTQEDVARDVASKQVSGLPFFVMSLPRLLESIRLWEECLPRVRVVYPLRCNSDPVLTRVLADITGVGFDACDSDLLEIASCLVAPNKIVFSNPCLTRKAIRHANSLRVGAIVVESETELMNVMSYAPDSSVLLRISTASMLPMCRSVDSEYGCSLEEAENLLFTASQMRIPVAGISFSLGAGCDDASVYHKAIRSCKQLWDLGTSLGLTMNTLCIGGGFSSADVPFFHEISEVLCCALDQYFPESANPSLEVIATPGRFFAAPAFSLCTTVIGKRRTPAHQITNDDFDNGYGYVYQTNEGLYGSFGCRLIDRCSPKCRALTGGHTDGQLHHAAVLGPNLDGHDIAQPHALLPQLSVGEWLLWENMGAYSIPTSGDVPLLPVYYFDSKHSWNARVSDPSSYCDRVDYDSMSEHGSVMNSSESESDTEFGVSEDSDGEGPVDEDGLTDYLGRVFYAYN